MLAPCIGLISERVRSMITCICKFTYNHVHMCVSPQGQDMGETLSHHALDPTLPKHYSSHRDLMPYAELMLWLKGADITSFHQLAQVSRGF